MSLRANLPSVYVHCADRKPRGIAPRPSFADVIFIGPFDLAKSMNVKFGGDEHQQAISTILEATKAANKHAAIFVRLSSP